jgi:hypothetical protein
VHHAAQAHLQSHIAALNTQATPVPHHQHTTTLAEASTAGSQVHHDGSQGSTHYQSAHIDLRSPADPGPSTNHHFQDMNLAFADTSHQQMDRCLIQDPDLLLGIRCFVDASTAPDQQPQTSRSAGIGIIFLNSQVQPEQKIQIKAIMTMTQSVIMAEAAALALAVKLA